MLGYRNSAHKIMAYTILCVVPSIFPMPARAFPRDPNNSALLYYQAFFICPEVPRALNSVVLGGDPNDQVRQYLNRSPWPETIELIQAGTRLSECNWGLLFSRGQPLPLPAIRSLNRLTILLGIQARTLAADGQFRSALENCICMRRFAAHIGDDTFEMWALSEKMDAATTSATQYVLGVMPPNEALLTWLKDQLGSARGATWRPEEALNRFRDMDVQLWRTHLREHKAWKEELLEEVEDKALKEEMRNLSESQLFDRALQSLEASMRRTLEVLQSDGSYSQKCAELAQVTDRAKEKAKKGEPIACLMDSVEHLGSYYRLHINATAPLNALMNAIEVYLAKAKTGRLPQELPANLPEDPYSGKSFEYEITKEGFVLRCRAKSVDFSNIRQFAFRVRA